MNCKTNFIEHFWNWQFFDFSLFHWVSVRPLRISIETETEIKILIDCVYLENENQPIYISTGSISVSLLIYCLSSAGYRNNGNVSLYQISFLYRALERRTILSSINTRKTEFAVNCSLSWI